VSEVVNAYNHLFTTAEKRIQFTTVQDGLEYVDFVEALKAAMRTMTGEPKIASAESLYQHFVGVVESLKRRDDAVTGDEYYVDGEEKVSKDVQVIKSIT
jgi:hypothetical protein